MKKILILLVGILLMGTNIYAGNGDLLVIGSLGVGTMNPADKVVVQLSGDTGSGITAVSGLVLKAPDSQHAPALTFIGGGPYGGDTGKIVYDSGNGRFNFWGGGIGIPAGSKIIFDGVAGPNNITVPTRGNGVFHFDSSVNLETKTDNSGKVIVPYGNVGIGTTNPNYKLDVAGSVNASGGYSQVSDIKFKKDIQSIDSPLKKILNMQGVSYSFRTEEYKDRGFADLSNF